MKRSSRRLFATATLMLLAQLAHAQFSWIDDKGTRVFSDRPPPPGTPASRILKAPRAVAPRPASDAGAVPAPSPAAAATTGAGGAKPKPPTLAEQEAGFRQRQAQREDDARKAQDTSEQQAAKEARCALARQQEAQMSDGARVSQVNAQGERYFLSDEDKAKRVEVARKALQDCR